MDRFTYPYVLYAYASLAALGIFKWFEGAGLSAQFAVTDGINRQPTAFDYCFQRI